MKRKSFLIPITAFAVLLSMGVVACNNQPEQGDSTPQASESGKQEKITISAAENKTKLILGETVQLTASVEGVTWSSSDESIATVSPSGLVTSVAVGKVSIKANKEGYKEGSISISIDLEKITVSAAENKTSLLKGETVQLTASATGVSWESDNPEIATVSNSGLVTAVKVGDAVIRAKLAGMNDGTITIHVVRPEASATFDMTTAADHYSADGWWSTTVDMMGMSYETGGGATPVTGANAMWGGTGEGDTYIGNFGAGDKETLKFNASKAGKAEIVVKMGNDNELAIAPTMNIKFNDTAVNLANITLPAHQGQYGASVDFELVSLDELDIVAGENVLLFEMLTEAAPYLDEVSIYSDATITLINPPAKTQIAVEQEELSVILEETVQIPTQETGVTYVSENEAIATVNDSGLITGVAVGRTNILLKKEGMYSIKVAIAVNPKPVTGQIVVEAESAPEVTTDWQSGGYMKQEDGSGWGGSSEVHSGGAYISFMSMGGGAENLTLTLTFTAAEAKTMILSVVGSTPVAWGSDPVDYVFADSATITLNEVAVPVGEAKFTAPESTGGFSMSNPMEEVVIGEVAVKAGENTLVFTTNGSAPALDCFKLSPKA